MERNGLQGKPNKQTDKSKPEGNRTFDKAKTGIQITG